MTVITQPELFTNTAHKPPPERHPVDDKPYSGWEGFMADREATTSGRQLVQIFVQVTEPRCHFVPAATTDPALAQAMLDALSSPR